VLAKNFRLRERLSGHWTELSGSAGRDPRLGGKSPVIQWPLDASGFRARAFGNFCIALAVSARAPLGATRGLSFDCEHTLNARGQS
jgi:hypothetical protein